MTATRTAARQAIKQALRQGDRVRVSRFSVWRCGLGALLLVIAVTFEVWSTIHDQHPWYSTAVTVFFPLLGVLVFAFVWGSDRNAAVQFRERDLIVWDWRGRESSIPYDGVQAVRARRSWGSWMLAVCREAEGEGPAWRQAIWYPSKDGWLITTAAAELADRCNLIKRSNGLWARSPVCEVP